MTHDYSAYKALVLIGQEDRFRRVDLPIVVGDNCFIGARATILLGTVIGNNCIIEACSVVIGNPAVVLKRTKEYAEKYLRLMSGV